MIDDQVPSSIRTTIINTDQPVEVRIGRDSDGRWFRILNWLIDSGIWADLSDIASKVLVVIARHASSDGTSLPSHAAIQSQSGLSRTSVYDGLRELLDHPAQLLAKKGSGAWVLFPGRPFAGRGTGPAPPVGVSAVAAQPSAPAYENPPLRTFQSAAPDALLRPEQREDRHTASSPNRTVPANEFEAAVALLMNRSGGAQAPRDARELAAAFTLEEIRDAIANADDLASKGKLKTRRGYVANALKRGYGLFDHIEKKRDKERHQRLARRVYEIVEKRVDQATADLLNRTLQSPERAVALGVVTEADFAQMNDDQVYSLIVERARRTLDGQ